MKQQKNIKYKQMSDFIFEQLTAIFYTTEAEQLDKFFYELTANKAEILRSFGLSKKVLVSMKKDKLGFFEMNTEQTYSLRVTNNGVIVTTATLYGDEAKRVGSLMSTIIKRLTSRRNAVQTEAFDELIERLGRQADEAKP